jgi:hypothetical protein
MPTRFFLYSGDLWRLSHGLGASARLDRGSGARVDRLPPGRAAISGMEVRPPRALPPTLPLPMDMFLPGIVLDCPLMAGEGTFVGTVMLLTGFNGTESDFPSIWQAVQVGLARKRARRVRTGQVRTRQRDSFSVGNGRTISRPAHVEFRTCSHSRFLYPGHVGGDHRGVARGERVVLVRSSAFCDQYRRQHIALVRSPLAPARSGLQDGVPAGSRIHHCRGPGTGIVSGTWMAATTYFQSAIFPFVAGGFTVPGYAALYALTINFGVSIILSWLLNPIGATYGSDETRAADYCFASTSAS